MTGDPAAVVGVIAAGVAGWWLRGRLTKLPADTATLADLEHAETDRQAVYDQPQPPAAVRVLPGAVRVLSPGERPFDWAESGREDR